MGQPTIVGSFVQKEASDGVVEVLSMPRTREILRLRFVAGLSCRQIARSIGCSRSAGPECLKRAAVARLHWPLPEELDEAALESRLYPPPLAMPSYSPPDFASVHAELMRMGVTRALLWEEYKAQRPEGL